MMINNWCRFAVQNKMQLIYLGVNCNLVYYFLPRDSLLSHDQLKGLSGYRSKVLSTKKTTLNLCLYFSCQKTSHRPLKLKAIKRNSACSNRDTNDSFWQAIYTVWEDILCVVWSMSHWENKNIGQWKRSIIKAIPLWKMKVVGAVSVTKVWVPFYMRGERSARDYNTFECIKEILWTCAIQSECGQCLWWLKADSSLLSVKWKKRTSFF